MPDLSQSLQGRDLGHFRVVAELWGLEFSAPDARVGLRRLVQGMLENRVLEAGIAGLPTEARAALDDLLLNDGRLPWALFTRRYGSIREMGPGRRDRDLPHHRPVSPAEMLWYRALVARSFFDAASGPEEFAYIPDDLLPLLPDPQAVLSGVLGRPATPAERLQPHLANHFLVDHACTLLAALRLGLSAEAVELAAREWKGLLPLPSAVLTPAALHALLSAAGLLEEDGLPRLEPARDFLEAGRGEALAILAQGWLRSPSFNELRLIPHLRPQGEWENEPVRARQAVLDFLSGIPFGKWWSLAAFAVDIRQKHPDFQRPAGDYDSWFIQDARSEEGGEFLRGFEHWDRVDGEVVRYILCGPMHWLGMTDIATPAAGSPASAFRLTAWGAQLLKGAVPEGLARETELLAVGSDGKVIAPRLVPRSARYQLARFCSWEGETGDAYRYRITPASLARARQQGLNTNHLLLLLRRHSAAVPPTLARAVDRWEQNGPEARLERVVVLRLSTPDLLAALRSSRAARFLGEPLGPTTVIVKEGAADKVLAVLAEMGYLGEARFEGQGHSGGAG
jgi:hypothetical protein